LAVSALDSGLLARPNSPISQIFLDLFVSKMSVDRPGHYQIVSTAANALRLEIFRRASQSDPPASTCRQLLAAVEKLRIEYGRPLDEVRHPDPGSGTSWTEVLISRPT